MVKNFKILSVPTYIVLKDGQEVYRANGAKTKEQLQELVSHGE
jgi:thioredoxin-like negative regulator of GroEL